jgi:hypothetical protein
MKASINFIDQEQATLFENRNTACGKVKKPNSPRRFVGEIERYVAHCTIVKEMKFGLTLRVGSWPVMFDSSSN